MTDALWIVPPVSPEAAALARELGLPPAIAQVLARRGVRTAADGRAFLSGGLEGLHDPFLLKGMAAAVARIKTAVERRERILIFGDYDVDGVLSTVMLFKALRSMGAEVDYFIPERLRDGYGIKPHHVDVPVARGTRLVVSVDCGIKDLEFAAAVKARGIDLVVTDHHRPGDALPDAVACLDPVLPDAGYPDRDLAGVGVAFKLIQALLGLTGQSPLIAHYLKLVAIGTVADVAQLRGENRIFVKHGLKALGGEHRVGLRSLIEACGLANRSISEGDLGFRIGPRLNAAGRMGKTDLAVRLFLSDSADEVLSLVQEMEGLNSLRQRTEGEIFEQAKARVEERKLHERYRVLVLGCETWHRGVVGIVASRLKDYFHRPVLLFTYQDGKAFGSGRSISDCVLIELLDGCREHFLSYGGHRLAVGCTLARESMPAFKAALNARAEASISDDDLRRKIRADAEIGLDAVDDDFVAAYQRLVPFGVGNPKPLFVTRAAAVYEPPRVMKDRHLKFRVMQAGRVREALWWGRADAAPLLSPGVAVDLAWSLHLDEFRGERRVELSLEDLKVA